VRPDLKKATPYSEWTFSGNIRRMPEFTAPALGNKENVVTIEANIPANASGVIYALGGFSAGLSLYIKDGVLSYEYNLFEIQRTQIKANEKMASGKSTIEVTTTYAKKRPAGPLNIVIKVDGKEVANGLVPVSAPLGFTVNDCLDIGIDLGSPVSIDYFDEAPYEFTGTINNMRVKYVEQ
jgi:arylsulfatase